MTSLPGFEDRALRRDLSANLTGFCRLLRQQGLGTGPGEQSDALRALELVGLHDASAFRAALRTTLAKNPEEQELFDQCFERYWMVWDRAHELNRQLREKEKQASAKTADKSAANKAATVTISDWLKRNETPETDEEAAGYSPFEVISRRDFKGFSATDMHEIIQLITALGKALATRFSRRYQQSRRRGRLDLRRTLRLSLRRGGELVDLAHHRRRLKNVKLVLLCDVSKSMDLYSRFLIQFIYAFQSAYRRIETFAFSTSLHRITPILKKDDLGQVLGGLSGAVPDWSGGTKIGGSLSAFLDHYGGLVDRHTVVLIMSDGWDTGEIELLEDSMDEIQRRARCLIWLNPLMGSPTYEPSCRGMQAALPFVDILASAHNLDSLRQLVRQLGKIQRGEVKFNRDSHPLKKAATPALAPAPKINEKIDRQTWLQRFGKTS
jgi:uncharacterized protein with von Willebrand factor type A (vWA) domain